MEILAICVLVAVAIGIAASLHFGPHGTLVAGLVGLVAAVVSGLAVETLGIGGATVLGWGLLALTVVGSGGAIWAGRQGLRAAAALPPASEPTRLWGEDGTALSDLAPTGTVRVRGETWSAEALSEPIPAGSRIHVAEVDGLRLRVWADTTDLPGSPSRVEPGSPSRVERAAGSDGVEAEDHQEEGQR